MSSFPFHFPLSLSRLFHLHVIWMRGVVACIRHIHFHIIKWKTFYKMYQYFHCCSVVSFPSLSLYVVFLRDEASLGLGSIKNTVSTQNFSSFFSLSFFLFSSSLFSLDYFFFLLLIQFLFSFPTTFLSISFFLRETESEKKGKKERSYYIFCTHKHTQACFFFIPFFSGNVCTYIPACFFI